MLSLRVVSSRRLVDVGGQEVSRSKSDYTGDEIVEDGLWTNNMPGDVVGFGEMLVMCMTKAWRCAFTWHEQNGMNMQSIKNN
jgi:hypothetical protein